ncbi:MAG: biotin--[acetyl-CoA-carboxylase] ligase [Vicingaceae bacterium]
MYNRLFIGEKRINLVEIDSTNAFMKELVSVSDKEVEGLVVTTECQVKGRGQQGNVWESEPRKNLTFSIYLKPNILIQNQFVLSKVVSLGIIDFLIENGLKNVKIKWPNDIYVGSRKIAGILIENLLKSNKVDSSIVGIGLNVNQSKFSSNNFPTSLVNILGEEQNLEKLLNQLLFFIEKRYISLKQQKAEKIKNDYLKFLLGLDEMLFFEIANQKVSGKIKGVSSNGKLQVELKNEVNEFDLKEIKFLIN